MSWDTWKERPEVPNGSRHFWAFYYFCRRKGDVILLRKLNGEYQMSILKYGSGGGNAKNKKAQVEEKRNIIKKHRNKVH